ncbi:t-SNARE [Thozetella sp. PMI_491]|nr:t-SNARE [Thozetella sp. PMI_491]
MSFDQLSSLEAGQRSGSPGYSDDPEFKRLSQDLMDKLFKLRGNNQRLSGEVSHLGTRRDTPRVRERVHELLEESREQFKEVGEGVKKIQTWEDPSATQKYTQQKLSREFQVALSDFQGLQRQALEKQKASVSAAKAAIDSEAGASGSPQQEQQLQQQELTRLAAQDEVDFQEALIIEREEEIRHIEQGVGDLNVLFQQVAQIVTEQGEQLDTIANNVENVRTDTEGADLELRRAARYQRQARGKACCLLIILAVIAVIIILAVVIA